MGDMIVLVNDSTDALASVSGRAISIVESIGVTRYGLELFSLDSVCAAEVSSFDSCSAPDCEKRGG